MNRKILIHIVVLLLSTAALFAKETTASGLLFLSGSEQIDQRTTLELFDNKYKKFRGDFSIDFEISIVNTNRFGYIFRLLSSDGQEVNLVFVNFRREGFFIDFNSSANNKNIPMRILSDLIGEGKWIQMGLDFNLANQRVTIRVGNDSYDCTELGFTNPLEAKIIFGLHGINLDVPAMAIRNIVIKEGGRVKYNFPLNESSGEFIHDIKGRKQGRIKNPMWLINNHFNWSLTESFSAELNAGIAYNNLAQELYIINRDSICIFNLEERKLGHRKIETLPFGMISSEAIYNSWTNQTYIYDLDFDGADSHTLAKLNMETLELDEIGSPRLFNRLHHHNMFFPSESDSLYIFGGYGNFRYSNILYRYDERGDQWTEIPLEGDGINPRFFAASGKGESDNEVLIFGGFGNKSGRQELGGKNLYDLNSIDLTTMESSKLWEIETDSLLVPATNLILSGDRKSFYALLYPHHISNPELKLYQFDIATGERRVVSNGIRIISEEIATRVYLFENRANNEFVAVVREFESKSRANIRIYSLSTPPVSAEELVVYEDSRIARYSIFALIGALALTILGVGWKMKRKRKKESQKSTDTGSPLQKTEQRRSSAIYVFGDFTVYDKKGQDISYRFSGKLRSMFALLLLHSTEGEEGVSTERMSRKLWSDRDMGEAKNVRGVTVSNLRKVLLDVDNSELLHEKHKWALSLSDGVYCDYNRFMKLCGMLSENKNVEDSKVDELIEIASRGALYNNISEVWLDSYRHKHDRLVERVFKLHIRALYEERRYDRIVTIVEALLIIDPLNEDILSIGIKVMKKIDRADKALKLYNRFAIHFREAIGSEYPEDFASFE